MIDVQTADELLSLAPEWRGLCAVADVTPFQRPEWLLPWWHHFGSGPLRTIAVRHGGELVGLAPLYLRRGWQGGRELAFVGAGNTDYLDIVAAPAHRDAVTAAIIDRIVGWHRDWDQCDLAPLGDMSPLLAARAPNGWNAPLERLDVCPVLSAGLDGDLRRAVPPRLLRRLDYACRHLTRKHAVTIDEAGPSDAPDVFVELCRLHAARWGERGRGGVLADTTTLAFHCDVIRQMAEARLLRLYLLRVDGVPAAGYYGFSGGRRWFYYLGGFDPAYRGHSVGSLVILHAVEQAARGGARELDFLRGAEPYKYGWGAVDCAVQRWRLVRASSSAGEAA